MQEFEHQGWWWLPSVEGNEENAIAGTLSFSIEKGLKLQLIGVFSQERKDSPFIPERIQEYQLLHGQLSGKSQSVTLVNCFVTNSTGNLFDPSKTVLTLHCETAYIGNALLTEPEEAFREVSVRYTYLLDWIGRAGFDREIDKDDSQVSKISASYSFPTPRVATISGVEITFENAVNLNRPFNKIELEEQAIVRMKAQSYLKSKEWLKEFIAPLQNLLSLAVDRSVYISEFFVISEASIQGSNNETKVEKVPLQVVFQPIAFVPQMQLLNSKDVVFLLNDVETDLGELLGNWLKTYEKFDTACNLYFSGRSKPSPYLSGRFLVLAQAAEIFHRVRFPKTVFTPQEFESRKQRVLENVPEEYQQWVKEQLAWSNELSLKQRLDELYAHTHAVMRHLVSQPDEFIKKVRDTRNYYTHFSTTLRKRAGDGVELHWLTEVLRYMLVTCLLLELGFSLERIEDLANRNENFNNTKRQLARIQKRW